MHTEFWWRNLREGYHLEGAGIDGTTTKMDLRKVGWGHGLDRSGSG